MQEEAATSQQQAATAAERGHNLVGPVLRAGGGDVIEAVIAAIHKDNPDREIRIVDQGGYIRVQAPMRLRVTSASVEEFLGRPFKMTELEVNLSSFAGRIRYGSDEVVWEFERSL